MHRESRYCEDYNRFRRSPSALTCSPQRSVCRRTDSRSTARLKYSQQKLDSSGKSIRTCSAGVVECTWRSVACQRTRYRNGLATRAVERPIECCTQSRGCHRRRSDSSNETFCLRGGDPYQVNTFAAVRIYVLSKCACAVFLNP